MRQSKEKRERWTIFIVALLLLYTFQALVFASSFPNTIVQYVSTIAQLFLMYTLGKEADRLPIVEYSLLLPVMLLCGVVSNYFLHPSGFTFPVAQFFGSWILLQAPVLMWARKQPHKAKDINPVALGYVLVLFFFYQWRLSVEHANGAFLQYEFSPCYTWLCLILSQLICSSSSLRRLMRLSLTRIEVARTAVTFLVGLTLIVIWDALAAMIFRACGFSVTIVLLGPTLPPEVYANQPLLAVADHLMLIFGTYLYVAIAEEVFFRLTLPAILRSKLRLFGRESFWTSLLISAALFGSIHYFQVSPAWTKVLYSFVSGLIFASLRHYSRNLQASSMVHALTNDFPCLIWI